MLDYLLTVEDQIAYLNAALEDSGDGSPVQAALRDRASAPKNSLENVTYVAFGLLRTQLVQILKHDARSPEMMAAFASVY